LVCSTGHSKLRAACILLPASIVFTGERHGSRSTEEQPVNLLASMLFVWASVATLSIAAAVLIVLGEARVDPLAYARSGPAGPYSARAGGTEAAGGARFRSLVAIPARDTPTPVHRTEISLVAPTHARHTASARLTSSIR
jgi:hypothetical protein